jgi:membrane fusion protein
MDSTHLPHFRDISWRWICYATSTFLVVAIAFAFFHEIELKQDVKGEIFSPAELKIQGLSGLVSVVHVQSNEHVAQGAPLFVLEKDLSLSSDGRQRPLFDEQVRDEQVRTIAMQYSQRKSNLKAQLDASLLTQTSRRAEVAALDDQLVHNRRLVSEFEKKVTRLQSVSDYVMIDRIEQAKAEMHQAKAVVAQGAARRQQLQGELAMLRSTQTDIETQLASLDGQHARELQDLSVRFEQTRQNVTISAPKAGIVSFSNLITGQSLEPEDVALVIDTAEGGPLRAALHIPSRRRGFVREGQTVRLKFDAFPYERFGSYEARIDSISGTTIRASALTEGTPKPTAAQGGGDYMAWATLRGDTFDFERQQFKILSGMRATASIVVERRTIAEWVLAPLFRVLRG